MGDEAPFARLQFDAGLEGFVALVGQFAESDHFLGEGTPTGRTSALAHYVHLVEGLPRIGELLVLVVDLLAVIADWNCADDCPADVNGDYIVNVEDVLIVLANYGCT